MKGDSKRRSLKSLNSWILDEKSLRGYYFATLSCYQISMPDNSKLVGMNELQAGQTVRLHERIKDVSPKGEERERIQVFEGIILALGGKGISRTVTVRKVSDGIGVEKIYPINSPVVAKIELVKTARVRQAKLGFIKNLKLGFKRSLKETYTELGMEKKKK